ncbi:unnamed protein product [Caenorhabditis brenneri]
MKLLVLFILFLGSAHSHGSHEDCLQKINGLRANFSRRFQIANMNELEYDEKIETAIREEIAKLDDCSGHSSGGHDNIMTFVNFPREEEVMELASAPGTTKVACMKNECNGKEIFSFGVDWSGVPEIRGPAGTKCPSDRVATPQGLCARPKENRKSEKFWKYE